MASSIFLLFLILISTALTTANSSFAATYANCDHSFSCGSIINATYPFSGGDRPYCGLPEFSLTCRNEIAELTHDSITYRVLSLNQILKTLILARADLYNETCPSEFRNTTLNSTIFNYGIPQNEVLNLFYGCNRSSMGIVPPNLFHCNSSRFTDFSDSYRLIGPVPRDPILNILYCSLSVSVPILKTVADQLSRSKLRLGEALMQGFMVDYRDLHERRCSRCIKLGGQCGFDTEIDQPLCICDDRSCPFDLSLSPKPSPIAEGNNTSKRRGLEIGLSLTAAVLVGVGLGWLITFYRQRRKKSIATAEPAQRIMGKEIMNLASSQPSDDNYSTRIVLSYPSTESNIGVESTYSQAHIFSYHELEEATDNFDRSRAIGDGGYGTVYYGILSDGCEVAIKRLYETFSRMEHFANEVEILTRLRHPNLVTLHGCTSKQSRELLLVYEYIPNGTVADHLNGNRAKSGLLSWPIRLNIAMETAGALAYLHKSNFIHRDVKTTNILLDNDFHVKVSDFGLSRLLPHNVTHVSTAPQGTPGYVDPEYYQYYQLTEKSDVYSFGVVLIELISSLQAVDTNRLRHDINLSNMAVNKIQNHLLHELVDPNLGFMANSCVRRMITSIAELAFQCLQQEREMRPCMEEVFQTLKRIQNNHSDAHQVEIVDLIVGDDVELLKNSIEPPSPDSVSDKGTS